VRSKKDVWAVAFYYRYIDGEWRRQLSPVNFDLYGIDMWDSMRGRIGGEAGAILSLADRSVVVKTHLYLPAIAR
jgi:hypothetical protein